MKIGIKLSFGFGIIILFTMVLGISVIFQIQKLSKITENIYLHPLTVGNTVRDIKTDIIAMHRSMKDVTLAINDEQISAAAATVNQYEQQAYSSFNIVNKRFLGDPMVVDKARRAFEGWKVIRDEVITLSKEGKTTEAAEITKGKGADYVDYLITEVNKMIDFASSMADKFLLETQQQEKMTMKTLLVLFLLIFLFGIISSILITRSIVKPLRVVVKGIDNLSKGDLQGKILINSKDEIGQLARSFDRLQKDLLQRTGLLRQIASGDFSTDIPPRSEKDDLGKSFYSMTSSLKKAKDDLAVSELKYINLTESVPIGIAVTTYNGEIIELNSHAMKLFGFKTKKNALKYLAKDFYYYPEDRNSLIALLEKGSIKNFEYLAKRKDGTSFWALLSTVIEKSDMYGTLFINSFMDISERKKTEESLEKERRFVLLLQKITAASNELSTIDEVIQVCLDELCTLMDWPVGHVYMPAEDNPDLLLPTKHWHMDNPEKFTAFREATVKSTFKLGIGLPGRIMNTRQPAWIIDINTEPKFIRTKVVENLGVKAAFGFPVLLGDEVIAVLEFFSKTEMKPDEKLLDVVVNIGKQMGRVAERTRTEETLKTAKIEADSANRAKSEFLSGMSHELRTPLNAILGFSQVLDGEIDGKLNESQKGYVHTILESGKHLLGLINDILDLSKIEAGKIELFVEPLNIEEIVGDSLIMIETRSSEQHISLKLELDELVKNTTIHADGKKLKQIMYNLLSNAVKFTPGKGSILVKASIISENLEISVKDSGIGIIKKDQDKIFQKFFQTKGGMISKTKGTGLGLNIVKNLVELHGGELKVESEGENKGTTFTFTIPIMQRELI